MSSISIWNDKIVLKTNEELSEPLKPYAKYNEKFGAYLLWFSHQNLKRIFQAFEQIPVTSGQERIDALKMELAEFKSMGQNATHVKSTPELPAVPYKVQPLGLFQHRGVVFLSSTKRAPMFASCGVGKTYMVLSSTEEQIKSGSLNRGKTLVCGKLATLETGWMEDCEKFTGLKAVMVWLKPSTHKRKEKMLKLLDEEADLYITNHDTVMTLEEELAAKKFQKVVIDESTILKSYHGDFTRTGGKFGKALMNVAKHADWRVVMSGTPAPNGPEDLWGQFKFLDPAGIILEPSFQDFRTTHMDKVYFGRPLPGGREPPHKWVTKKTSIEAVKNLITPFTYQIKIRDHLLELPEITIMRRAVMMSQEQHDHYMQMRENLGTIIDDELVAVSVRLAQATKLRQITGGFLIDQQENPHEIPSATKMGALDDLMEEIGDEKVIIYAQYRWEIKTIFERYKDRGALSVYGENDVEDNLSNIKEFIRNPQIKLIVLHPQSAAYGITFVVSHYMIFYSISHSQMENYQCVKRIERAGQKHPMFVYYLISNFAKEVKGKGEEKAKTIDEAAYAALQVKARNQDELLDQSSVSRMILNQL